MHNAVKYKQYYYNEITKKNKTKKSQELGKQEFSLVIGEKSYKLS